MPPQIAVTQSDAALLFERRRRGGVERHQTLRATVDWSYSLLEPAEQVVFDRLSMFSGGFDASAAAAVVTADGIESWDVIVPLVSPRSFVGLGAGGARVPRLGVREVQQRRQRFDRHPDAFGKLLTYKSRRLEIERQLVGRCQAAAAEIFRSIDHPRSGRQLR
jgi:hypothetical protein